MPDDDVDEITATVLQEALGAGFSRIDPTESLAFLDGFRPVVWRATAAMRDDTPEALRTVAFAVVAAADAVIDPPTANPDFPDA